MDEGRRRAWRLQGLVPLDEPPHADAEPELGAHGVRAGLPPVLEEEGGVAEGAEGAAEGREEGFGACGEAGVVEGGEGRGERAGVAGGVG